MIFGKLYVIDQEYNVLEENGKYFEENVITKERTERTFLDLAMTVSMYWSERDVIVEANGNTYTASMCLPLYDGVEFILYGYGDTEEIAKQNVKQKFDELMSHYDVYIVNCERNEENFMMKVKKFAYFYKNREESSVKKVGFDDMELVCEDVSTKTPFREFAIENGVPSDARADNPIFGYVDGNTIVFYKPFYIKGQREVYLDFVKEHYNEIAKHYNIENPVVYMNALETADEMYNKEQKYTSDMLTSDYPYYTPILPLT